MTRIVVGVDGSPAGRSALRWALEEARLRGAGLQVLAAFELPTVGPGSTMALEDADAVDRAHASALELVTRELAAVGAGDGGVDVDARAVEGDPRTVLVDASVAADLVVVGERGEGRFTQHLLGSVATAVLHHARCPVVVVRPVSR